MPFFLALRYVLPDVDKQQRLPVEDKFYLHVLPMLLPVHFLDVHPGALDRGVAVAVL